MRIKKKTYLLWKKIFLRTLLCLVISGIYYIVFRTHLFTITSYELVGIPEESKTPLIEKFETVAQNPRYKLLPTNRIYSYRAQEIKSTVVGLFPDTASIHVYPVSLHRLRISITHYVPVFKIDSAHAITADGIIYQDNQNMDTLPLFTIASSTQVITHKDGLDVIYITNLPDMFIPHLQKLVSQINSVVFTVAGISIDTYKDVRLSDISGRSSIIFSSTQDLGKIWSNLVSAIDTEPLKSKLSNTNNTLQYLDTRFGNKVFFKFTNDALSPIMPSYATSSSTTTPIR